MIRLLAIIIEWLLVLAGICLFVWLIIRSLKQSDDPPKLLFKWILSGIALACLLFVITRTGLSREGAFIIPFACVAFGVVMSIMWAPSIGGILAKPITSLFDGGDEEPEPRPFYSIARAQQKKGNYGAAVSEVRKQLDKFPEDVEGALLLAELQAEHLNDLPGAELTVQRLCDQPGHPPRQIAAALNQLADWHLKLSQDRDAASRALERIMTLFPNTEMALQAAQRIAHVSDAHMMLAPHDRKRIAVPKGVENLGLLKDQSHLKPAEIDPAKQAGDYVKHLTEHPMDSEAREKLALIYADHYHRLDLAADQLEQLIQQPNQPAKQVVHWLNLLADLQIKHANDLAAARRVLQRIIEQYPGLAAAENARRRLDILKLELRGKEKSQAIALGSHQQDIGVRRRV